MSILGKLWEQQYNDGQDSAITKEAAAHGMTPDEYLQAVARNQAIAEEQQKIAAENELAEGLLVSRGIQEGIAAEFNKMAAMGGNAKSCNVLKGLFVK